MSNLPKSIKVLVTTRELHIEGDLLLPQTFDIESSANGNILFYILNGGIQFLEMENCEVQDKKNIAFRPNHIAQLYVNITSIDTIQVIYEKRK